MYSSVSASYLGFKPITAYSFPLNFIPARLMIGTFSGDQVNLSLGKFNCIMNIVHTRLNLLLETALVFGILILNNSP